MKELKKLCILFIASSLMIFACDNNDDNGGDKFNPNNYSSEIVNSNVQVNNALFERQTSIFNEMEITDYYITFESKKYKVFNRCAANLDLMFDGNTMKETHVDAVGNLVNIYRHEGKDSVFIEQNFDLLYINKHITK